MGTVEEADYLHLKLDTQVEEQAMTDPRNTNPDTGGLPAGRPDFVAPALTDPNGLPTMPPPISSASYGTPTYSSQGAGWPPNGPAWPYPPTAGSPVAAYPMVATAPQKSHATRNTLVAILALIVGLALAAQALSGSITSLWPRTVPSLQPGSSSSSSPSASESEQSQASADPGGQEGQLSAASPLASGVVLLYVASDVGTGAGTGMIVDSSGIVVTNYHVVEATSEVTATLATNGRSYTATVLGADATNDIAVLQLKGASGLDTVKFDDDILGLGDQVSAVGNANGQGFLSRADGEVTDLTTTVRVSDESSPWGSSTLRDVIQTTAAAVPGDSGGPMYDAEGEVVGMTSAGTASDGRTPASSRVSYAITIKKVSDTIDLVRSSTPTSTLRIGPKPYLGISVSTSQSSGPGAQVVSVTEDGPAARAGVTTGDVITALGGSTVSSAGDISQTLAGYSPGDKITIAWTDTGGQTHQATLQLGTSPLN